jgi:hypothetical protein
MNKNNKNELRFWKDGNEINFSAQGTLGKFVGSIILIISGIILYPFLLLSRLVHGKPKAKSKLKPISVKTKIVIDLNHHNYSNVIEDNYKRFLGEYGARRIPEDINQPIEAVEVWLFDINDDYLRTISGTIRFKDDHTKQRHSNYPMFMEHSSYKKPDPIKSATLELSAVITDIKFDNGDRLFGDVTSIEIELEVKTS